MKVYAVHTEKRLTVVCTANYFIFNLKKHGILNYTVLLIWRNSYSKGPSCV